MDQGLLSWSRLQGPSLQQQSVLFDDWVTDGVTRGALVAIATVWQKHDLDHNGDAVLPKQDHLWTGSPRLPTLVTHAATDKGGGLVFFHECQHSGLKHLGPKQMGFQGASLYWITSQRNNKNLLAFFVCDVHEVWWHMTHTAAKQHVVLLWGETESVSHPSYSH